MAESHRKLDTINPDHLVYEHSPVQIAVLGGIRLERLERGRAYRGNSQ